MAGIQLTTSQISIALGMARAGASQHQIATELGIKQPTVWNLLHTFTITTIENHHVHRHSHRATTPRTDCLIVRTALKARHMSLKAFATEVNINVSYKTIQCRLKAASIRKCIARTKPFLSPKSMANRLQWALDHQHWTVEQWGNVIWSNE